MKTIYELNEYTLHELSIRVANISHPSRPKESSQIRDQQSSLLTPRNEDETGPSTFAPQLSPSPF